MNSYLLIVWLHFLGDFILQSDRMALNKSKSTYWLSLHALTYGIPLFLLGWRFAIVNLAAHWVVDFFTSKANAYLWATSRRHWFFVMVGFDQAIHMTVLFWTFNKLTL